MSQVPKFLYYQIDESVQNNFEAIRDYLLKQDLLKFEWRFFNFSVTGAVTNYAIPHNNGFLPTDLLTTAQIGDITFHYDDFTDKVIYITTAGAAKFRGLLGRYREAR